MADAAGAPAEALNTLAGCPETRMPVGACGQDLLTAVPGYSPVPGSKKLPGGNLKKDERFPPGSGSSDLQNPHSYFPVGPGESHTPEPLSGPAGERTTRSSVRMVSGTGIERFSGQAQQEKR